MLRMLTAGESHGPAVTVIIEGMPAGIALTTEDIDRDLSRRHSDFGRGGRGRIESDRAEILSGIRYGRTLGSPITLLVKNRDFANWQDEMRVESTDKEAAPLTCPRPGHADLAGVLKYGQADIRNILERASARETAARVMAGAAARKLLADFGILIASHTTRIGPVTSQKSPASFEEVAAVFERDPDIRCFDHEASEKMKTAISAARKGGDTLGGVVQVIATGLPAGLGSVMHYDCRLDGRLAGALLSIPSVKGVSIGDAVTLSAIPGSAAADEIGIGPDGSFYRLTNNAGGIEGGISNGENIVLNVYLKPLATLGKPAVSVDISTRRKAAAISERSDVCAVPRAGSVAEAMTAFTLAQAMVEKFGGDHIREMKRNYDGYLASLAATD